MSQTKVAAPFVEHNAHFKNLIINVDMHVRQRDDTSVHNNGVVKPCDMWQQWGSAMDNIQGTLAIDSSIPAGYGFSASLRFDTTVAESALAADEYQALVTHVEAQNAHHLCFGHSDAKATTLSWWSKSNLTGTDQDFVVNVKATDGSREITKSFYHAAANTWEKFTMAIPGDASGTINDDSGQGFEIKWILAAGSNFTSADSTAWGSVATGGFAYGQSANIAASTSNDFYITGVQLEVGDVATDYEYLPYSVQLQRCHRYYYKHTQPQTGNNEPIANGMYYSSSQVNAHIHFPVPMRASPSVVCTDVSGHFTVFRDSAADGCNNWTGGEQTENVGEIYNNSDMSGTAGHACTLATNNANALLAFSAELG